jgi:hypothetical protein
MQQTLVILQDNKIQDLKINSYLNLIKNSIENSNMNSVLANIVYSTLEEIKRKL